MSGMTTVGSTSTSDYNGRTVEIEVTGVCRQDVSRKSNYKIKIPYSRMVKTIQGITRMGGKISNISILPVSNEENNQEG
ncbi:MAG: phycobilisome linker polypeptide [Prochloraceae cyanobacterium]|nr:phycobilisome linker polypeptide [Prochloraceae cyanobacterium]